MGKAAKFLYLLAGRLKVVPLLDEYSGAAAAYSLRSLSAGTINVVKVRRSGDDAELDFTATEVSDGTLASWVTAGGGTEDGFVTTWYDQSGNANNATQATAANQPKIVSSGSLVTENGKAAVQTTGALLQVSPVVSSIVDSFTVAKETGTDTHAYLITSGGDLSIRSVAQLYRLVSTNANDWADTATSVYYNGSIPVSDPSSTVQAIVYVGGGSRNFETISSNFTSGTLRDWEGNIQEIILYSSDQSANRTGIEANINAHYNIYS